MSGLSTWNPNEARGEASKALASGDQQLSRATGNSLHSIRAEQVKNLKGHNLNEARRRGEAIEAKMEWDHDSDLWLYRQKTTGILRRYMRWSLEAGRVPSLLGRELFRSKISAYTATTFESRIIFLHDVETCLDRMGGFDRKIIARVVLQEHDHEHAARILGCDRKTIERRLPEVLDELTEAFLRAELLEKLPETKEEAV